MQPGAIEDTRPARQLLTHGWELCSTAPGEYADPLALERHSHQWLAASVPGTVAASLRAAGRWTLDDVARRFDAEDWWYRIRFDVPGAADPAGATLEFEGLATLCDIWLNGRQLPGSGNMFLRHVVAARGLRPAGNELHLAFRSLDSALKQRRPRPRWRTPMVENQQLRWFRGTLLGRMPGWSPPAAVVGPWKEVALRLRPCGPCVLELRAEVDGDGGLLHFTGRVEPGHATSFSLVLHRNGVAIAECPVEAAGELLRCTLRVDAVDRWFPHTHGEPALHEAMLRIGDAPGSALLALGRVGFRQIEATSRTGGFGLACNGVEVFCRGACWTPLDIVTLGADGTALRRALEQVVAAGFNMLRVGGPFVYEDEPFFALCDELGILVWQDFMFANMDYPAADETFATSVRREASQHLALWARHPCVAVVCGNSEVSQQAAMWGAPRELWSPPLFEDTLRELTAALCPGVVWWPSSASGGDLPHQPDSGTTSYYGVGAYLRGFDDLRRSGLTFATECLGFANIPEEATLHAMPGGASIRVHHAEWKRRTPRDPGAGWDFDDVRDHYLRLLFDVDPVQLRYADHARYLQLSRRVPAEAMVAAFSEWRRPGSTCSGALVWFLRDSWPGAGWGLVDANGEPKAPWHALRQLLQPRWVAITDEGLNGLAIHLGNETARAMSARLELALYRNGRQLITCSARDIDLQPRASVTLGAAALLGEFHDLTHAYRFGPLSTDLVVATLLDEEPGAQPRQAFHLPLPRLHATPDPSLGLQARALRDPRGGFELELTSDGFARSVHVDAQGFTPAAQYFHLAPGATLRIALQSRGKASTPRGTVQALNSAAIPIEVVD
jgi:beta-mannosidase